jgi:hypothetical protein
MRILLIILFYSSNIFAQDSLGFKTVAYDVGVKNYQVQSAADTTKQWNTIATIQPKALPISNTYTSPISVVNIYYRAAATMINGYVYYTKAILYIPSSQNSATIVNAKNSKSWFTDHLTFSVINPMNVQFYLIEKSTNNGKAWAVQTKINPNISNSYSYNVFRFFQAKPLYRVSSVFTDNTVSNPVNFQ